MSKLYPSDRENPRVSGFSVNSRRFFALALFLIAPVFWASGDEAKEFFIGVPVDINMYSRSGAAFGGGLFLGLGGDGAALGIRALYNRDMDKFQSLEMTLFLRLYLPEIYVTKISGNSGFFAQLNLGPALFWEEDKEKRGVFCAGLGLGWRFLPGEDWFVEPALRVGYPFLLGVGVAAGIRM